MPAVTPDDTDLARRATGGDREAFSLLFDRWLDRAFDVAWHILYNREAAADAAQEAFAAAWTQIGSLRQPESFGGWLLRIARNKALNQLAKQRRSSPVGSEEVLVTMDPREADDPTARLEEGEYGDLVWAASAALGGDDASLLSLHLRHDLGTSELAEELGVKPNAVHQRLFRLKKRLADAIAAWVLWRKGDPSCPDLREILKRTQASSFDGTTAKAIINHAGGCEACVSSRKLRLSPEALFAAMPLVVAGPVLRARMVAALGGQGVPASPASADVGKPPETTELEEVSEPGWGDEPSDPDAPGDAGLPVSGDRWRGRARLTGAALAAVVLFIAVLGGVILLANRIGDGAGTNDVTSAANGSEQQDPPPGSHAGTRRPTSAGSDRPGTTQEDADAPEGAENPGGTGGTGPAQPGAVESPTTTIATGDTTTTDPDVPAPQVLRFTAIQVADSSCASRQEIEVIFAWATSNANAATLTSGDGRESYKVEPSGSRQLCAVRGSTWTLTATGPGGSSPPAKASVPGATIPTGPGDLTS